MRMRRKAWTEPVIYSCPYFVEQPAAQIGRWQERFARRQPVWLEIGCGKGQATARMAHDNPSVNVIAVDEVRHVLAVSIRTAEAEYGPDPIDNLLFSNVDATNIYDSFAPEDGIERIVLNFSNPWDEKAKHHKRRLTHPRQLMQYRRFLAPGGTIHFKTDNDALFTATQRYLEECGFAIEMVTDDLHASGYAPNYVSEHEQLYASQGCKIHFLIARMLPDVPEGADDALNLNLHTGRRGA